MTLSKRFFLVSIISWCVALLGAYGYAQTPSGCTPNTYQIVWPELVKAGETASYRVLTNDNVQDTSLRKVSFSLSKEKINQSASNNSNQIFLHLFSQLGKQILSVRFLDSHDCPYSLEKTITSYDTTILYIGNKWDIPDIGFSATFNKQNTLFYPLFTDARTFSKSTLIDRCATHRDYLQDVDMIVINMHNSHDLLQLLDDSIKINKISLLQKKIYVVSDFNTQLTQRVLAKYSKNWWIQQLYLLEENNFVPFLTQLSLSTNINKEIYANTTLLSFSSALSPYSLSSLLDRLVSQGFPIELLSTLLILSLAALFISIFRQVIGFSVFGIYSPLLFALSLSFFWVPLSILLLAIGIWSKLLVKAFTKRVYLLHNTKTALLVILYLLFVLIIFSINATFTSTIFQANTLLSWWIVAFPILFLIIVTDKVFHDNVSFFSLGWRISFAEFLIVSFCVYGLLSWVWLRYFLLAYPESILFIIALTILIGKFTWLQVLEYIRFMPLITHKSHNDEEEEE